MGFDKSLQNIQISVLTGQLQRDLRARIFGHLPVNEPAQHCVSGTKLYIARDKLPTNAEEIRDRVNEITFNSSLLKELRAVHFVQKLLQDGWIKEAHRGKLRDMLMHSIRADQVLADLSAASKLRTDWDFLTTLRERGRATAGAWLEQNFGRIGRTSSVDLAQEFL